MRLQTLLRAAPAAVPASVLGSAIALSAAAPVAAQSDTTGAPVQIEAKDVRRNVIAGGRVRVAGALRPGAAGRTVALDLRRNGRWRTVDRDRTAAGGGYRLSKRLRSPGSTRARVRFAGDAANAPTRRRIGRVNAYRRAFASAYGPGLFGNPLACGGRFTTATLGVAHKTLPCGTKLTLRYRGRTVRARVVDRGPFVAGREFDLTWATKQRLRHPGMGVIQVARW